MQKGRITNYARTSRGRNPPAIFRCETFLYQTIERVEVKNSRILEKISTKCPVESLTGRQLRSASRHGKLLFVQLEDRLWLTIHLGMSWLHYFQDIEDEPIHDRRLVTFDNGNHLAYSDQRMFGRVGLVEAPHLLSREKGLGPDVLDLNPTTFLELMQKRQGIIKPALIDQHLMAGLGYLYADEALFQANICPKARLSSMAEDRLEKLFQCIRMVLNTAISCQSISAPCQIRISWPTEALAKCVPRTVAL